MLSQVPEKHRSGHPSKTQRAIPDAQLLPMRNTGALMTFRPDVGTTKLLNSHSHAI